MTVLRAIGNSPLVELTGLNGRRPKVRIFAKLEGNNPIPVAPSRTAPPTT